jgi:uncharacterized protein YjiS (DUF1127 family)
MREYALHQAEFSGSLPGNGILARLYRNWRARRAVARLESLDDFLLHDIGVTREEVRLAAQSSLTVNAALALQEISHDRIQAHGRPNSVKGW